MEKAADVGCICLVKYYLGMYIRDKYILLKD